MDPEIEKIIKEQMEKLPIEVRKLFVEPDLSDKISNIGKKNGLNEEQIETLQLETRLVMIGLIHPDEYSKELKDRLKIDDIKMDNLISDIDKEILNGIRGKLIETFYEEQEFESSWQKNLDFISSGGDYSAFLEPSSPQENLTPPSAPLSLPRRGDGGEVNPTPPTLLDIQKNAQKTNTSSSVKKMTDIKSKFNI